MKKLIVFDLDGTLAASKQAIDEEMSRLLVELLGIRRVAVISGGDWPQFERQLLGQLPLAFDFMELYLLPTSGTKLFRYEGAWREMYARNLSDDESGRVRAALDDAVATAGLADETAWGEKIEDRGTQLTFSGLGQEAPLDAKTSWDPDFVKRKTLKALLEKALPDFSVRTGGSTSIDITHKGIDKAYGIAQLAIASGVAAEDMLFVGDALYPGGNDAPVRDTAAATIAVANIGETKRVIETIIRS